VGSICAELTFTCPGRNDARASSGPPATNVSPYAIPSLIKSWEAKTLVTWNAPTRAGELQVTKLFASFCSQREDFFLCLSLRMEAALGKEPLLCSS